MNQNYKTSHWYFIFAAILWTVAGVITVLIPPSEFVANVFVALTGLAFWPIGLCLLYFNYGATRTTGDSV